MCIDNLNLFGYEYESKKMEISTCERIFIRILLSIGVGEGITSLSPPIPITTTTTTTITITTKMMYVII